MAKKAAPKQLPPWLAPKKGKEQGGMAPAPAKKAPGKKGK